MKLQLNDKAIDLWLENLNRQEVDLKLMWITELVIQCMDSTNDKELLDHKEELLNQLDEYIEDIRDILDDRE